MPREMVIKVKRLQLFSNSKLQFSWQAQDAHVFVSNKKLSDYIHSYIHIACFILKLLLLLHGMQSLRPYMPLYKYISTSICTIYN